MTLKILALGGDGFLCTEAAFVPALCSAVATHWDAGEFSDFKEESILDWFRSLIKGNRDTVAP